MKKTLDHLRERIRARFDAIHPGIRAKLVALFILIKILPLILLAWLAWSQASNLGQHFLSRANDLSARANKAVAEVGEMAVADSVRALDTRARDDIERMTTDTAQRVASFLYARDDDIRLAASLAPDKEIYRRFIEARKGKLVDHGEWELAPDGKSWQAARMHKVEDSINFSLKSSTKELHYRPQERFGKEELRPLYLEISFVDLDGRESIKVTSSPRLSPELKDISQPRNTYVRAENYFAALKKLKPGEIYVSDVIGAYVGSRVVGHYTPESAKKAGIPYEPQNAAYAGKENPVGQRFKGLIRWATPVVRSGRIIGYVTLALDHDHVMEFTDHQVPTEERYSDIPDAAAGNYAFIWDHQGRSIAHPRHYFIPGFDPQTGEPVPAWLEDRIYADWQKSGKPYREFMSAVPTFREQGLDKKPATEQSRKGLLGLDCRYLNFAPQCIGWFDVTQNGGSGSFLILWSGLWKLTTAAAIPYHTGQYGQTPRGFGIVTIGANVDEFHRPATVTKEKIDDLIRVTESDMQSQASETLEAVRTNLKNTALSLGGSTLLMALAVILIAFWMASYLTRRITYLVNGIARFRSGDRDFRFNQPVRDEMGELASSFDQLASHVTEQMEKLEDEITERQHTENELRQVRDHLEDLVQKRTDALLSTNTQLQVEIADRRQAEQQARHLAEHDPLTGLPNRERFRQNLISAIEQSTHTNRMVAVLFFDLDNFKQVNDTLGHTVGDELLCAVAHCISGCIRSNDTVARLGGDEFAVIANQIESPRNAERIALSILESLSQPINVGGNYLHVGTSIGISLLSEDADAEQLIQQADLAMYQAKNQGGNRYHFYADDMHRLIMRRTLLEYELRNALAQEQFCLHYQPRHDLRNARLAGVEALLRWQHPERGLLSPGEFLDVAELSGILSSIDSWVLRTACRQGALWEQQGFDFDRIAINVSTLDLLGTEFVPTVLKALEEAGLSPGRLEIEITERALIRQYDVVVENLRELRHHGIHIAIDDFGMEHSSLQRLIECPINVLKIDRFFVSRIGQVKSEAVIAAVVAMAHSMRLELVAEGVETEEQQQFLETLGCHVIQGYLYAKPMPPEQLVG